MIAPEPINNRPAERTLDANILLRLKQETRPQHDAIERVPLLAALFAPHFDVHAYARLLSAQLHFYRPYEAMLKKYPHIVEQTQWRSKTALLEADLHALQVAGLSAQSDAQVEAVLDHPIRMLGVLYVFEGATLGGAVIRKHLLRTLGSQIADATNFYHCYGEHGGLQWKRFQQLLSETVAQHPEWADDIVFGARMTFISMTTWFTQFTPQQSGSV